MHDRTLHWFLGTGKGSIQAWHTPICIDILGLLKSAVACPVNLFIYITQLIIEIFCFKNVDSQISLPHNGWGKLHKASNPHNEL